MNILDLQYIEKIWDKYFPKAQFYKEDNRMNLINILKDFFLSNVGIILIKDINLAMQKYVYFNVKKLAEILPFDDFINVLKSTPNEVISCIGISLSLICKQQNPFVQELFIIYIRLYGFDLIDDICFSDIKSNTVDQLISIRGHVVRVSSCKPLIDYGLFLCPKCMNYTKITFEDGIFIPPQVCSTSKCYNKYLEFDRSSVKTIDYQRIKITEVEEIHDTMIRNQSKKKRINKKPSNTNNHTIDDEYMNSTMINNDVDIDEYDDDDHENALNTARIPKSMEIEVRDTLVNTCIPGDLLHIVGIVKSIQIDAPKMSSRSSGTDRKGGCYKESGLSELYILANSLLCIKSSGDRSTKQTQQSNKSQQHQLSNKRTSRGEMIVESGGTLLDEYNPQIINPSSTSTIPMQIDVVNTTNLNQCSNVNKGTYTENELNAIRNLAISKFTIPLLVNSLCPTIYGNDLVKLGLLLGLFGGTYSQNTYSAEQHQHQHQHDENTDTNVEDGLVQSDISLTNNNTGKCQFRVRPDIHVLVVGDPGLGKSQMLHAAAVVAPRSVFVCGNTSTTAGLTVSVSREMGKTGDLRIEAGALILADQGVCCIDELDKITAEQHSLLEAMEQQSISIAKSGVVTSLKSRTAVLAAANPSGGHYNRKKSVSVCENLKMNAALLSRFDCPDEQHDRLISEHIMKTYSIANNNNNTNHNNNSSSNNNNNSNNIIQNDNNIEYKNLTLSQRLRREIKNIKSMYISKDLFFLNKDNIIPTDLFRRYIEYAKHYIHPRLTPAAAKVLQKLYLTMRAQASLGQSTPVTTRHLESLIRLSQARAKMELREQVTEEDANDVVQLLQESLLDVSTNDFGVIDCSRKGGISLSKQVKALVKAMNKECLLKGSNMLTKQEIQDICTKLNLDKDVDSLIDVLRTECYLLLKGPRLYQLITSNA